MRQLRVVCRYLPECQQLTLFGSLLLGRRSAGAVVQHGSTLYPGGQQLLGGGYAML